MQDPDESVRDAAVRAICNWPDASVADELLELARNGSQPSHRVWAVRGLARVLGRQAKDDSGKSFEGLRKVFDLATRQEDKRLVLSRLTAARTPAALAFVLSQLEDPDLQGAAIEAAASLAEGMKDSHPQEARAALETVQKTTQDPELQLYITKLLWNMQLKGH